MLTLPSMKVSDLQDLPIFTSEEHLIWRFSFAPRMQVFVLMSLSSNDLLRSQKICYSRSMHVGYVLAWSMRALKNCQICNNKNFGMKKRQTITISSSSSNVFYVSWAWCEDSHDRYPKRFNSKFEFWQNWIQFNIRFNIGFPKFNSNNYSIQK